MSEKNPIDASGPVVTPPDHAWRTWIKGAGAILLLVAAYAMFWLMPARETGEAQKERLAQEQEQRARPGDPGVIKPWPKVEIPQPEPQPVVAEKPGTVAVLPVSRRRPMIPASTMWTAPTPPPPPPAATAATVVSTTTVEPKPAKLGGMAVMEAERIDDASWYLMPGDMIMCRNDQPLTERSGAIWTATIPEAKLSGDGTRTLLPAGSRAFGKIAAGFNREDRKLAGVITHIMGPRVPGKPTLFIPIDMGQVGDDLGEVDMAGNVKSNFWERLGTVGLYAILDAVARGATSYAAGSLNRALNPDGSNVNVNVGNFGGMGTGQNLAGMEMQEQLRKRPEFGRPEAQPCTIMISKPVDFRKALHIRG
jgi:type IV secretory pathway VirB10-like protein